jgi:hypothetical protein
MLVNTFDRLFTGSAGTPHSNGIIRATNLTILFYKTDSSIMH